MTDVTPDGPVLNERGKHTLTLDQQAFLYGLWLHKPTVAVLKECFDQWHRVLRTQLETATVETLRPTQAQIAMLKAVWFTLAATAEGTEPKDANTTAKGTGTAVPHAI